MQNSDASFHRSASAATFADGNKLASVDRVRHATDLSCATSHGALINTHHHGSSVTFCNVTGIGGPAASGTPLLVTRRGAGGGGGGNHLSHHQRPSTINFDHGGGRVDAELTFETLQTPLLMRRSCSSSTLGVRLPDEAIARSSPVSPSVSSTVSHSPTMTGDDASHVMATAVSPECGGGIAVERKYSNTTPVPVITCDGVSSSMSSNQSTTTPKETDRATVTCHRLQPTAVTASRAALLLAPPTSVIGSTVPSSLCGGRAAGCSVNVGGSTGSKTVLVTPYGSFLSVNQSPAEFRESTLSIGGASSIGFNNIAGKTCRCI